MRNNEIEMFAHEGTVEDFAASLEPARFDNVRVLADRIRSSKFIRNIVVCTFVATPFVAAGFVMASQESSQEPMQSDGTIRSSTTISQREQQCIDQARARFGVDPDRDFSYLISEVESCKQQDAIGVNSLQVSPVSTEPQN
jgi:hypothetical protein